MMTFIHTYTEDSWAGLVKNGLWRDGDGLKLMHKPDFPPPYDFNRIAAPGGDLFRRLEELRCPFYVDRLQGGIGLPRWYRFDPALVRRLCGLLEDKFWGWQMHEWASNYRSDTERILALYRKLNLTDPSPEERHAVWQRIRRGEEALFLESLTPEEWTGRREPRDRAMFTDDLNWLYAMRSAMTDGLLIPADSYQMAPRIEIANGAKLLLPEVGWQIPNMRIQTAYTRGEARAHGVRWGIYYECWCHTPAVGGLTIPFSLREGQDEWIEDQLTKGTGADRTPEEREEGGTSRNLQERAWRYAYLSGATVIGEEYGVSTTFRDLRDFSLSPYGRVKKEFLGFAERFPETGEPFTPIAVVLPKDLPVLHVNLPEDYLGYPPEDESDGTKRETWERIRAVLPRIFGSPGRRGNHSHILTPGGLPDAFDILHEDQEAALGRYDYFIDLTGGEGLRKKLEKKSGRSDRIVTPEEADRILTDLLPLRIGEGVHTLYTRTADGWLIFAANNAGIECSDFRGDVRIPEAALNARIRTEKTGTECRLLDGTGKLHRDGASETLFLEAGDWVLLGVSDF